MVLNWVNNYEGLYQVTAQGRIWSLRSSKFLKTTIGKDGYERVQLVKNKIRTGYLVHRIVAEAFLDNPRGKRCVDHINGNRNDNKLSNLRWATHRENILYSRGSRQMKRGAYYHKRLNKYEAAIMIDGGYRLYLGVYNTKQEAYEAFYFAYVMLYNCEPFLI